MLCFRARRIEAYECEVVNFVKYKPTEEAVWVVRNNILTIHHCRPSTHSNQSTLDAQLTHADYTIPTVSLESFLSD